MFVKKEKYGGFLLTELIIGFAVLGMLLAGLALSLNGLARLNRYELTRQRCISAATAELDSITVTGEAVSEERFARLWPKLSVSVEETAGTGQWEGMELVKVKTSGMSYDRQVKVELARYIAIEGQR